MTSPSLILPRLPPVTKFIRIGISDKNDNPPYFDKQVYEAEVDENEDFQHIVLTVVAKDIDECEFLEWVRVFKMALGLKRGGGRNFVLILLVFFV